MKTADPLPRMGLGCARIGSFNNPMGARGTQRLLERALELGVTLFDTADIYGQGDSERAIGRLLKGRPEAGFVVTKIGHSFSGKLAWMRPLKPILKPLVSMSGAGRSAMGRLREASVSQNASIEPARIAIAAEACLRRLGLERIDALLLHDATAQTVRDPRTLDALAALRERSLIGAYGVSCLEPEALTAAASMPGIGMVQTTPAMLEDIDEDTRARLAASGAGIVLREVVTSRRDLAPVEAAGIAAARHPRACIVVGTTSRAHLEEMAMGLGVGPGIGPGAAHGARPAQEGPAAAGPIRDDAISAGAGA